MEVILREDIGKLGRAGDVVKVKDGYARNYLLPNQMAYVATAGAKRRIEHEQQSRQKQLAMQKTDAESLATALGEVTLNFTAKTGDGDRLFGSITSADIADQLAMKGHHIDKRAIDLSEPIKMIGEHRVAIRLHPDVRPEITVAVTKE